MPRLTAGELTPDHLQHLVTVSSETAESITFTLQALDVLVQLSGETDAVILHGQSLGNDVQLSLPAWHPVHVYLDDISPTARQALVEITTAQRLRDFVGTAGEPAHEIYRRGGQA